MASSSFGYIFKKPRGGSSEVGFSTTSNTAATRNIASKKRRKGWGSRSEPTHLTHESWLTTALWRNSSTKLQITCGGIPYSHTSSYTCPTCTLYPTQSHLLGIPACLLLACELWFENKLLYAVSYLPHVIRAKCGWPSPLQWLDFFSLLCELCGIIFEWFSI